MQRKHLIPLAAVVLCCSLAPAQAAQLSDNFTATVTINASCSSVVADDVALGAYDGSADVYGGSNMFVTCTAGLPYSVAIDLGSHSQNGNCAAPDRRMANGANFLDYEIYYPAPGTSWGCDSSNDIDGIGSGSATVMGINVLLPAGQSVPDGYYQDNLVATITF